MSRTYRSGYNLPAIFEGTSLHQRLYGRHGKNWDWVPPYQACRLLGENLYATRLRDKHCRGCKMQGQRQRDDDRRARTRQDHLELRRGDL